MDLPCPKEMFSLDNLLSRKTCIFYESGSWKNFTWDLIYKRHRHVTWMKPNGQIILMGGGQSNKTSEIISISANGSKIGFALKHPIRYIFNLFLELFIFDDRN